jgi:hypothetical protein
MSTWSLVAANPKAFRPVGPAPSCMVLVAPTHNHDQPEQARRRSKTSGRRYRGISKQFARFRLDKLSLETRRTAERKVVQGERADLGCNASFQLFIVEVRFDQHKRVDLAVDEPHVKLDQVVRTLDVSLVLESAAADRVGEPYGHLRHWITAPAPSSRHEERQTQPQKPQRRYFSQTVIHFHPRLIFVVPSFD